MTGISAFFQNSTSRSYVVDTIVGKRIPQFVQTRWSSRSKIINLVVDKWKEFHNVFEVIMNDPKSSSESIYGASGHLKNLKNFEFAFLAQIFSSVFLLTDNLFNTLQNKSFDMEYCLHQIDTVYDLVNKKRNDTEFKKMFSNAVALTKLPKASRNSSNLENSYKILFFEIIDNILMQIKTRFQNTNKLIFLQLADISKFKFYASHFPEEAFKNLGLTYSNIFLDLKKLKVELEVLYCDTKYHDLNHIYDLVKIFELDGLKTVLPEVYQLFILILTLPSTSVSVERSFSCLKRIKTYLCNTISQDRLSYLSIISIEKELIVQLKTKEVFYDEVINMYANKKNRNIDLMYKS